MAVTRSLACSPNRREFRQNDSFFAGEIGFCRCSHLPVTRFTQRGHCLIYPALLHQDIIGVESGYSEQWDRALRERLDKGSKNARFREREWALKLQTCPTALMHNFGRNLRLWTNHGEFLGRRGD